MLNLSQILSASCLEKCQLFVFCLLLFILMNLALSCAWWIPAGMCVWEREKENVNECKRMLCGLYVRADTHDGSHHPQVKAKVTFNYWPSTIFSANWFYCVYNHSRWLVIEKMKLNPWIRTAGDRSKAISSKLENLREEVTDAFSQRLDWGSHVINFFQLTRYQGRRNPNWHSRQRRPCCPDTVQTALCWLQR